MFTDDLSRAVASGRYGDAMRKAYEIANANPLDPKSLRRVGRIALEANEPHFAIRVLELARRLDPRQAAIYGDLAAAYVVVGEHDTAVALFDRALALGTTSPSVLHNYARALQLRSGRDAAAELIARALALEPETAADRFHAGLARLARRDWQGGWEGVEARRDTNAWVRPWWAAPWALQTPELWTGQSSLDRTIWVHPEGGFGDVFFFARFLPEVSRRVGRVVVTSHRAIDRVLLGIPGVAEVRPAGDPSATDCLHVALYSLPPLLGRPAPRPDDVPYLRTPADGPTLPPRAAGTRLRVGLVWAGSKGFSFDGDRSVPDATVLQPLCAVHGVEFVSLQVGPTTEWADALAIQPAPPLRDFADTAFVLAQLDLVITVDTAVANLAGALGTPVWVMVPSIDEFRWLADGTNTPWYPTATVFRRNGASDWPGVLSRVTNALRAYARDGTASDVARLASI